MHVKKQQDLNPINSRYPARPVAMGGIRGHQRPNIFVPKKFCLNLSLKQK